MTDRERLVERGLSAHEDMELVLDGLRDRLHGERLSDRERTALKAEIVRVEDIVRRLWQSSTQAKKAIEFEAAIRPIAETLTELLRACTDAQREVASRRVPRGLYAFIELPETVGQVSAGVAGAERELSKWSSEADDYLDRLREALEDADRLDDFEAESEAA